MIVLGALFTVIALLFVVGCDKDGAGSNVGQTVEEEDFSSFDKYGKYGESLTLTEIYAMPVGQREIDLLKESTFLTVKAFSFVNRVVSSNRGQKHYIDTYKERFGDSAREFYAYRATKLDDLERRMESYVIWKAFWARVGQRSFPSLATPSSPEEIEEEIEWLETIRKMREHGLRYRDIELRLLTEGVGMHPDFKRKLKKYFGRIASASR